MLFIWLPCRNNKLAQKVNKLPSTEEILCTTGFYKLSWLAPKESNINEYQTSTKYQFVRSKGLHDNLGLVATRHLGIQKMHAFSEPAGPNQG
jgi:hypothetical protein